MNTGTSLVVNNFGVISTVDLATGETTELLDSPFLLTDIDIAPNGNVFGIGFGVLYDIDLEAQSITSSVSIRGNGLRGTSGINALEIGNDGTIYATSSNGDDLFTIDPLTGQTTAIGTITFDFRSAGDLQFVGENLYVSDVDSLVLIDVDGDTFNGASVVGPFGLVGRQIYGLALDEEGDLVGFTQRGDILDINIDTGRATIVGDVEGIEDNRLIYGAATIRPKYRVRATRGSERLKPLYR